MYSQCNGFWAKDSWRLICSWPLMQWHLANIRDKKLHFYAERSWCDRSPILGSMWADTSSYSAMKLFYIPTYIYLLNVTDGWTDKLRTANLADIFRGSICEQKPIKNLGDKKALPSQRRPRDAPNIWVPWKVSRVLANAPGYFSRNL